MATKLRTTRRLQGARAPGSCSIQGAAGFARSPALRAVRVRGLEPPSACSQGMPSAADLHPDVRRRELESNQNLSVTPLSRRARLRSLITLQSSGRRRSRTRTLAGLPVFETGGAPPRPHLPCRGSGESRTHSLPVKSRLHSQLCYGPVVVPAARVERAPPDLQPGAQTSYATLG